jgi:asparagine synthase (glutamine-hydrolysing)
MCGIHFILDRQKTLDREPVRQMCRAAVHRGPDHSAHLSFQTQHSKIFLGSNRLKILDYREAANQPFTSSCGRYTLIYNGEIYDFEELKNKLLQKGRQFRTQSDTEVLLELLIEKGIDALSELNGMFAFVFYDHQKEQLLLARDRHGIKPLFYSETNHHFLASSEIKGILSSGLVEKKLKREQLYHYLQFRYAQKPQTVFDGIFELEAGHYIQIEKGKVDAPKSFIHNLSTLDLELNEEEILLKTEELLTDAIFRQLNGESPKGLFLSGGVDSTLILALLQSNGFQSLQTYSITQDASEDSFGTKDSYFAKKAARQYGFPHHEVLIKPEMLQNFEAYVEKIDQPIGDSGAFLTHILSGKAAQNGKIAFSGAGADELFAGYNRHQAFYAYLKHYILLQLSQPLWKTIRFLPTGFNHPFRKQFQLLKKLSASLNTDPAITFGNFASFRAFHQESLIPKWTIDQADDFVDKNFKAALRYDYEHYLQSDVLAISDRMSMQQSLELRVPYLDNELVDFARQLSAHQLMAHGPKWILKDILKKYGGEVYAKRAKEGFGLPFGNWIRQKENAFLLDYLTQPRFIIFEYVDYSLVQKLVHEHLNRKADYTLELWSLLTLSVWLEKNF